MRNIQRLIAYVRKELIPTVEAGHTANVPTLDHDLGLLSELLNALPNYEESTVLDVFFGKEEEHAE